MRSVAATPATATIALPSRMPRGIAAQAPARTAPNTRPRRCAGTISVMTVKSSGLIGPATSPSPPARRERPAARAGCEREVADRHEGEAPEEGASPRKPMPDARCTRAHRRAPSRRRPPSIRPRAAALSYSCSAKTVRTTVPGASTGSEQHHCDDGAHEGPSPDEPQPFGELLRRIGRAPRSRPLRARGIRNATSAAETRKLAASIQRAAVAPTVATRMPPTGAPRS